MVSALLFDKRKAELKALYDLSVKISVKMSEEDWLFKAFENPNDAASFLGEDIVDFVCIDVTAEEGIDLAKKARQSSQKAMMMLVADETVSPMKYLNASIFPNSLLLRPIAEKSAANELGQLFLKIAESSQVNSSAQFKFNFAGSGKLIPYSQIYYFEARDKKIYLNTSNQEFEFYETIDHLSEILPQGFLRSHRSFIVSKSKIDSVLLSKNYIELTDGQIVPLSRSYKSMFKEL